MKKYQAGPEEEQTTLSDFIPVEEPVIEMQDDESEDSIFPQEHMEPLRGLLFLGKLENEVFYGGHSFLLRTLTEGELLRVGQLCKPYVGTMAESESRRMYVVAAAIEMVDGQSIVRPYKDGEDLIYTKSREVRQWYPAVISFLFDEYIKLEKTSIEVSNALKK